MNHAEQHLLGLAVPCGNGHAEMRNIKIVVHRAVDGIDDPFHFAVASDVAFLFTENRVGRIVGENDFGDEFLAAHIQLQLDVVALHFIDREIGAEVASNELTRLRGGVESDGEE